MYNFVQFVLKSFIFNLLAIRKHLQDGCPHSGQRRENNGKFAEGKCAGSIRDIARWLLMINTTK